MSVSVVSNVNCLSFNACSGLQQESRCSFFREVVWRGCIRSPASDSEAVEGSRFDALPLSVIAAEPHSKERLVLPEPQEVLALREKDLKSRTDHGCTELAGVRPAAGIWRPITARSNEGGRGRVPPENTCLTGVHRRLLHLQRGSQGRDWRNEVTESGNGSHDGDNGFTDEIFIQVWTGCSLVHVRWHASAAFNYATRKIKVPVIPSLGIVFQQTPSPDPVRIPSRPCLVIPRSLAQNQKHRRMYSDVVKLSVVSRNERSDGQPVVLCRLEFKR